MRAPQIAGGGTRPAPGAAAPRPGGLGGARFLGERLPPPGGGDRDGWRLGLGGRVGHRVRRGRVELRSFSARGLGLPPVLRPVGRAGHGADQQEGEGNAAGAERGEEEAAADERDQDRGQRGALHPAGQQPPALVLALPLGGDQQPGEPVEDEAQSADDGEHDQWHPEDHRVQVEVPPHAPAHTPGRLVGTAAAQLAPRARRGRIVRSPGGGGAAPGAPPALGVPRVPAVLGVPGAPAAPGAPDVPTVPGAPGAPAATALRTATALRGAPGVRRTPGVPGRRVLLLLAHTPMVAPRVRGGIGALPGSIPEIRGPVPGPPRGRLRGRP